MTSLLHAPSQTTLRKLIVLAVVLIGVFALWKWSPLFHAPPVPAAQVSTLGSQTVLARVTQIADEGQIMLAKGYAHPSRTDVQLPADIAAKLLPESAYGNLHFPTGFDSFTKAMQAIVTGWTAISAG